MIDDPVVISITTTLIVAAVTIVLVLLNKLYWKYIRLRNEQNGHVFIVSYRLLGEKRPGSDKQRMLFDAKILRAHSKEEAKEKVFYILLEKCYLKSQIEIREIADVNDNQAYWKVR